MDFKINNVLKTYGITKPQSSSYNKLKELDETKQSSSALELSSSVVEYNSTLETVKATDDVREDVVAKYKGLLDSGDYSVSVSDLADKLLEM